MTYRQQKGLTLTLVDLNALEVKDTETDFSTDVCKLSRIEHERPVLFHELVSGSSASSSSIENINEPWGYQL